jgi:hypothetical protein
MAVAVHDATPSISGNSYTTSVDATAVRRPGGPVIAKAQHADLGRGRVSRLEVRGIGSGSPMPLRRTARDRASA